MQYHLDGFRPGDPEVQPAADRVGQGKDRVDVLIVGCGPAGLTLAAQLAAFPQINTRIVERKPGPMEKGQADGISCRSMEMFNAFGFAETVLKQGYWVNETTFWTPDPDAPGQIRRNGRVRDVEEGLSEMPHIILNQARVHDMYLDRMVKSPSRLVPDYGLELSDLTVDPEAEYPVTATLTPVDDGTSEVVQARYVVGCDGARSNVRRAVGRQLVGDSANKAWGVMDVLAVTDFPDIRCKTLVQSEGEGNILIIPREGGYLVRLYIELDKLNAGERVAQRNLTEEHLIAAAKRIFQPYSFDVKQVAWWSVYEIGQRLTDRFDDVPEGAEESRMPHVFIAGDACHTHSPKAGQGMNVSMGDAFNLGWKLAAVLRGQCPPAILHSYSAERHAVADDLIRFDREWSRIMSERPEGDSGDAPLMQSYFIEHGRYTAGMSVTYAPSILTGPGTWQGRATGFPIGARFHSAPVLRVSDAKRVELGQTVLADGRWRLFAFAGKSGDLDGLCRYLAENPASPVRRYTPAGADPDAVFDLRAILPLPRPEYAPQDLPPLLFPTKGALGISDYEKLFCACDDTDIYRQRGIDAEQGCLVIVRPDQYVAHVLPLDAHDELAGFFDGFMLDQAS
ncbi:MAG: phenol 2-monooxygenase [Pseudooceanicola sp.]|jgi:phenol 2-monooxygenase|nr:phenol 2-monooxygenase [Pseudooceanicola sp.]